MLQKEQDFDSPAGVKGVTGPASQKGRWRRWKIIGAIGLGVIVVVGFFQFPSQDDLNIEVAKGLGVSESELLLRVDGTVKLTEMVNKRLRRNATGDNNIVVDVARIYNENSSADYLAEFSQSIGAEIVPGQKQHFRNFQDERLWQQAWKDKEAPEAVALLAAEQFAIDQLVEASGKSRYYHPLLGDDCLAGSLLPVAQGFRASARAILTRAMNRLGNGEVDEAIRDIAAVRRIAYLMDQSFCAVEHLVMLAMHNMVIVAEQELLQKGDLSLEQLRTYRALIAETTQLQDSKRVLNSERLMMLDLVQALRRGQDATSYFGNSEIEGVATTRLLASVSNLVDWSIVAEEINQSYDELIELSAIEDDKERIAAFADHFYELQDVAAANSGRSFEWTAKLLAGAKSRGRLASDSIGNLFSDWSLRFEKGRTETMQKDEMMKLAFALAEYRKLNGKLPADLEKLKSILDPIPQDRFANGPFTYTKSDLGFTVSGVGRPEASEELEPDGISFSIKFEEVKGP